MRKSNKNSICLIAARGISKGVPNKNIRLLGKKPLIAYAIETALDSDMFDHVVVSTENSKIAKIAKEFGAEVPFQRPKHLATDSANMSDVIEHTILKLRKLDFSFDTLVNRDCTVPFINSKDISGALSLFNKTSCDLVCSVYKQHHNPYFNMVEKNKHGFLRVSKKSSTKIRTRQSVPVVFQLNGLFVIDVCKFMKYKKIYMPKTLPYEISPARGLMIDTEFEFKIAEFIVEHKLKI